VNNHNATARWVITTEILPLSLLPRPTMLRSFVFVSFALLASLVNAGTNQAGLDFLAKKKQEEGVVETASGLLYKEIRPGTGPSPTITTKCSCHYAGRLIDGSK
jgi:hypothetical protein